VADASSVALKPPGNHQSHPKNSHNMIASLMDHGALHTAHGTRQTTNDRLLTACTVRDTVVKAQ